MDVSERNQNTKAASSRLDQALQIPSNTEEHRSPKHAAIMEIVKELPIISMREKFLDTFHKNQVSMMASLYDEHFLTIMTR